MLTRPIRAVVAALAATLCAGLTAACSGNATGAAPGSGEASSNAQKASPASAHGPDVHGTTVTLAASGDILVHYAVQRDGAHDAGSAGGYDFRPMFAQVRRQISGADVAICHQETTISLHDTALTQPGSLVFNAPHEIAPALKWAGFDGCDNASNHSWDHGLEGISQTVKALQDAGLQRVGPGPTAASTERPALYHVKGVTIAQLAYTYTLFNDGSPNKRVPREAPWLNRTLWPLAGAAGIVRDAKAARGAGANLVVVSIHWGTEYDSTPTPDQRRVAEALLSSGAVDLILGDHVHLVQPCQKIHGRYVLYGMGNFLSNQAPSQAAGLTPANEDGTLNVVTFTGNGDGTFSQSLQVQPTFVRLQGHVIERATRTSHPDSLARTTKVLHSLGAAACDATVLEH